MIGALILLWSAQGASPAATAPVPMQFAQVVVRQQIIVRTIRSSHNRPSSTMEWKERKGPKCLHPRTISGAAHIGQRSVDLVLRTGARIRARLGSSCPALDYYSGFYLRPGEDGLICADRESIRSRAGGECEIDAFRELRPVPIDEGTPERQARAPQR